MSSLTERIMDYDSVSELNEPLRTLDDVRARYQGMLLNELQSRRAKENQAEWDAFKKQLYLAGKGMIKEWDVYLRVKGTTQDGLEALLPSVVEEVYGSMVEYGAYGQSLIDLSDALDALLNKMNFSLKDKLSVKGALSLIAAGFEETGKEILEISKA